ncbi:Aldose 1-epimerase [bioreactor metagenome]|uniref:Aldose 1-epimerase n=1 Tax=bioreactor metagenome TaxID=1076179 RepID=A0A645ECK7_9ZZZZ
MTHNENETCLHGGGEFSHAVWDAEVVSPQSLKMTYVSPDSANGFNGEMTVSVVFTLDDDNLLSIEYAGVCTEKTIMNFTNHSYFNLGGYAAGSVRNHLLTIDADFYTPMDKDSIPTGEIAPVKNTPFDFTNTKPIGQDIDAVHEQIRLGNGYDHNFCLNKSDDDAVKATVICPETGRKMLLYTDLPGVQLYTGNFLDNIEGKNGTKMHKNDGFCLETQFYPDTPNQSHFPNCVVEKESVFKTKTAFCFCINK